MAVPYLACMALVAQIYSLPPRVLPAIQAVEGGGPGVVSRNTDGSSDLGVMQINTLWLPTLARYTKLGTAEVRERLIHRPCFNIAAAGLIMRTYLDETKGDLMLAIGNYHSHTPFRNQGYQAKVRQSAAAMFGPRPGR
ncbi:MAG: lytic transglycosylase domain-containing protein [Gemmatimonadaceae bacterium]|nr:lytic transglycosylase domain-containing protein [Acetobacteraceae bacterium]